MAQTEITTPSNIVERNIALAKEIMRYLLNNPQAFRSLPDKFELVILPEDDPEIRLYNLELLDRYESEGKAIVFARIKTGKESSIRQNIPDLYAPVAIN
ncbi:MAG: hypothetical protein D6784_04690 [Chloroflexi bacterium]|nr:MAG: hypothetical protein D6784_04690 [Chloroflexota bacterium]